VHFISGVTIYAINAPTEILNMTLTSPWLFSLVYNGSYMLVDTIICLVVFGHSVPSAAKISSGSGSAAGVAGLNPAARCFRSTLMKGVWENITFAKWLQKSYNPVVLAREIF
jgi:hypothetical protein